MEELRGRDVTLRGEGGKDLLAHEGGHFGQGRVGGGHRRSDRGAEQWRHGGARCAKFA